MVSSSQNCWLAMSLRMTLHSSSLVFPSQGLGLQVCITAVGLKLILYLFCASRVCFFSREEEQKLRISTWSRNCTMACLLLQPGWTTLKNVYS